MVPYPDVQQRVLGLVEPLQPVAVPLGEAAGAVLGGAIAASTDLPPFDCSAMDGYAVRAQDLESLPAELSVIDVSSCGHPAASAVTAGTAVRILTGAVVPDGADTVIQVEFTDGGTESVSIARGAEHGANIRRRGEVARAGEVLIGPGVRLNAGIVAVAAETGHAALAASPRPKVAVVSTGDELVGPDQPLLPGQIRDSNKYLLGALAERAGAEVTRHHLDDDADLIGAALRDLAATNDVVLTTGGVSMGAEFDPLRAAVADEPVDFVRVAVKPAKPLAIGHIGSAVYLGLPGNPVAALVSFCLFVRPVLRRLQGHSVEIPAPVPGLLAAPLVIGAGPRVNMIPVRRAADGRWIPNRIAGSHALVGAAASDALAIIPAEGCDLAEGATVDILALWADD